MEPIGPQLPLDVDGVAVEIVPSNSAKFARPKSHISGKYDCRYYVKRVYDELRKAGTD